MKNTHIDAVDGNHDGDDDDVVDDHSLPPALACERSDKRGRGREADRRDGHLSLPLPSWSLFFFR